MTRDDLHQPLLTRKATLDDDPATLRITAVDRAAHRVGLVTEEAFQAQSGEGLRIVPCERVTLVESA